jgi:hypothetical protein
MVLFLCGIVLGSTVVGNRQIPFCNATLFACLSRLHSGDGPNIALPDGSTPPKSFELPVAVQASMISSVATRFDRRVKKIGNVYLLLDPLPAHPASSSDRINALYDWLQHQPGGRTLESGRADIRLAVDGAAEKLAADIGPTGEVPFAQLTPDQQRNVLALMKGIQLNQRNGSLTVLLYTMKYGQ